jgi:hypothetical protein
MSEPEPYRYRRPERKRCARCGERLPFADFRPNPRNTYYKLHSWCRGCCAAYNREWRERHREQIDAYNASLRRPPVRHECSECGAEFFAQPNKLTCSDRCRRARWRRLNPEKQRARERRKAAYRRERIAAGKR